MPADTSPPISAATPMAVIGALPVFKYSAQTNDGLRIAGTLEATDGGAAVQILEGMRLRVMEVAPVNARKTRPLRDDAFITFNRQLAQLATAGMPIEKGLRMAAAGIHGRAMARAAAEVADDMHKGVPLVTAFEKRRGQFPPLYGRIIDAGIRGGNLAGVLLKLGRGLEVHQRLAAALWRGIAYPLVTLCLLLVVISLIGMVIMPRFETMFVEMRLKVPLVTQLAIEIGRVAPIAVIGVIGLIVVFLLTRSVLRKTGGQGPVADRFLIRLPVIGPVMRFNLIARWVDAVSIGVTAGLDLSASIALAAEATASRSLKRDGAELVALLATGRPMSGARLWLLPATVPTAIELSVNDRDLPDTLQTLSDLYNAQAELRVERIPAMLTPLLVMLIAILVGLVIAGLILPLILAIRQLSNLF